MHTSSHRQHSGGNLEIGYPDFSPFPHVFSLSLFLGKNSKLSLWSGSSRLPLSYVPSLSMPCWKLELK